MDRQYCAASPVRTEYTIEFLEALRKRGFTIRKLYNHEVLILKGKAVVGVFMISDTCDTNSFLAWTNKAIWDYTEMSFAEQYMFDNKAAFKKFNIPYKRKVKIKQLIEQFSSECADAEVLDNLTACIFSEFPASNSDEHVDEVIMRLRTCENYWQLLDTLNEIRAEREKWFHDFWEEQKEIEDLPFT